MEHVGLELFDPAHAATRALFYAAVGELGARYRRLAEPPDPAAPLAGFELQAFSQNGEDGVVAELLRRTGVGPGFFAEFGAGGGNEGICVALAELLGWAGLFIEAGPELYARLERRYRSRPEVRTLHAAVTADNVEGLFAGAGVPADLDVLAIDIDGSDYWVWRALSAYSPRIVVMEYNAHLGDEPLTVPADMADAWDGTDYFGASIGALEGLAGARGYRLVHTDLTGTNAFFVREDLAEACPPRECVAVRAPNYFLSGLGHRPDPRHRAYVTPPVP